ncbi:Translation initiation factor eIF-2B subunit epsilon [Hamiltosporidium tvaerminnensis]|nr:Translation initiation factor eIF-2B subunit epsilon [Hamiltosporidium tvaerminnensis]
MVVFQDLNKMRRLKNNSVLLICDYYNEHVIPIEMINSKKNIALFPISNVPLIEYIVKMLEDSKFTDVYLAAGVSLPVLCEYFKNSKNRCINIKFVSIDGKNFADFMRELDEKDVEVENLLVMYANHFTTLNLKKLLTFHKTAVMKDSNVLMTIFLSKKENTDKKMVMLGRTQEKGILFYDRVTNNCDFTEAFYGAIEAHTHLDFCTNFNSPGIFVIDHRFFPLFTEHFDFKTIEDFLIGILAFNVYEYKILYYECENTHVDSLEKISNLSLKNSVYSKVISTVEDYFQFNDDIRKGKVHSFELEKFIISSNQDNILKYKKNNGNYILENFYENKTNVVDSVIGFQTKIKESSLVNSTVFGNNCEFEGKADKCIIWDGLKFSGEFENSILVCKEDSSLVQFSRDYTVEIIEQEEDITEKNPKSFFDDFLTYLDINVVAVDLNKIDFEDARKQISLLRIVWNASTFDILEGFGMFFVKLLDVNDVDNSTIAASFLFPLLYGWTEGPREQDALLASIFELLKEGDREIRKEVIIKYGFLLMEDGFVSRDVVKKYRILIKKGLY